MAYPSSVNGRSLFPNQQQTTGLVNAPVYNPNLLDPLVTQSTVNPAQNYLLPKTGLQATDLSYKYAMKPTGFEGYAFDNPLATGPITQTDSMVNTALAPNELQALAAADTANQLNAANAPGFLDYANVGLGLGQLGLGLAQYEDTRQMNKKAKAAMKENIKNAREARQFRSGLAGAFA